MTDPLPRRFRFSLRFLLAWVLLTSVFLKESLDVVTQGPHTIPPTFTYGNIWPTSEVYRGWLCRAWIQRDDRGTFGTDENRHTDELDYLGMSADLAVCALAAFLLCCAVLQVQQRFIRVAHHE